MRVFSLIIATLLLAGCAGGLLVEDIQPETVSAPPATSFDSATHIVVTVELGGDVQDLAFAEELSRDYGLELVAQWPLASIDVRCLVFQVAPDSFDVTLAQLQSNPDIQLAQPVFDHSLSATPSDSSVASLQTNMRTLNAEAAHRIATGRGVRIAVIDTGLDAGHPDLREGLELVRNFVGDGAAPPAEWHGTAVAGLIGAKGGLRGVAFNATLLALRGCWQDSPTVQGACNTLSLARSINFAAGQGVDVINLSISGPEDPLLTFLIEAASESGAVLVAAAQSDASSFPASHPRVIAAHAAETSTDIGEVSAPAENVLSTAPGGTYDFFSGSSIAAAQISGIAALMREIEPTLAPADIHSALRRAATSDPDGPGLAVDACRALLSAADSLDIDVACPSS